MKKMKRITAGIAAFIMAASVSATAAFAADVNRYLNADTGHFWYSAKTGYYYETKDDAVSDTWDNGGTINDVSFNGASINIDYSNSVSSTYRYYCAETGRYYKTQNDASNDALYNYNYSNPTITDKWASVSSIDYRTVVSSTYRYYCAETGRYYKTQSDASDDALYNFGKSNPTITDKWASVSNIDYRTTLSSTYRYYCTQTGRYYKTKDDASNDALYNFNYSNPTITDKWASLSTIDYRTTVSSTYRYYCTQTGRYYKSKDDASNDALYNYNYSNPTIYDAYLESSTSVSSTYPWYSSYTGRYYKTQADAISASNNNSTYVKYAYSDTSTTVSATYPWYSSYTGKYYKTQAEAITASNNISTYVTYAYVESSSSVSSTYPWYSSYTKKYYKTQADALKDSNNQTSYVSYAYLDSSSSVSATYPWYSSYTKKYYKSQTDALTASNNNTSYVSYAMSISAGTPYVNNNKSYNGWTGIASYLQKVSSGTVTIRMNGSETVSSDALKAIEGKNVSVQFILKNGIKWVINGSSVDVTDALNISSVSKNTVPSSAIKPYTKNAISKAQVVAGSDEPLGLEAKISVKFNLKRAGCKAYVYHYDTSEGKLTKVVTTKVSSTGYCTFRTDEGGAFVIILK